MDIDEVRRALAEGRFDLSDHALQAMDDDGLWRDDIQSTAFTFVLLDTVSGERGTQWLLEGHCGKNVTVRLAVSWISDNVLKVITVYVRRHRHPRTRKR